MSIIADQFLRKNIFINIIGKLVCALIMLLSIPFYVQYMGIESYGIIGVFTTIQTMFSLLDLGLSRSLNREIAVQVASDSKRNDTRDVLRTTEILYWLIAIILCVALMVASGYIGKYWIRTSSLQKGEIQRAIWLMGLVILFQWPQSLYFGGLQGLQKHFSYNLINVISYGLRYIGGAVVILTISKSISAFFSWQVIACFLSTAISAIALWRAMPKEKLKAQFKMHVLKRIWRYALGLSGISITVLILSQLDKVILSNRLSMRDFGYYMLAGNAASIISIFTTPIFITMFPLLSGYIARRDERGLKHAYHQGCQLISLVVIPLSLMISLFSLEILRIGFSDSSISINVHLILSILVIGNGLNSLVSIPYALQLATGWTALAFKANIVSIALFVPLIFLVVPKYGGAGAALIWTILNIGYLTVNINIMHKKILKDQKWLWYRRDIGIPALITLSILLPIKVLVGNINVQTPLMIMILAFSFFGILLVLASTMEYVNIRLFRV